MESRHRNRPISFRLIPILAVLLAAALAVPAASADWEDATAAFAAGDYERAAAELESVVDEHPEYAPARSLLGQALLKLGDAAGAVEHLEKAVALDDSEPRYRLALAQGLVETDDPDGALETLAPLRGSVPGPLQPAYAQILAAAATRSDSPDPAAAAELERLAQGVGDDARLWLAAGSLHAAAGDDQATFEAYRHAFLADSSEENGRRAVLTAFRAARDADTPTAKRQWYERAAEVADELSETAGVSHEALLLAGEAHLGAGQDEVAQRFLDQARAAGADPALIGYYRGRAAVNRGDEAAAIDTLEDALRSTDDAELRTRILNLLGFAHSRQGSYATARSYYEQAGNSSKAAEMNRILNVEKYNKSVKECQRFIARYNELRSAAQNVEDRELLKSLQERIKQCQALE